MPSVKLSKEYLEPYINKHPFKNVISHFVYLRTYSRYLENLNRREQWHETIQRSIEYSYSLYQGPAKYESLLKQAEHSYDKVFNLKWSPAGRTLWSGGVEGIDGLSQFNCAFQGIDKIESFSNMLYALCLGVGVGFSVERKYINKLPRLYPIKTTILPYQFVGYNSPDYLENTKVGEVEGVENKYTIYIGDSKEGWAEGLKAYLWLITDPHFYQLDYEIKINLNSIRPEGSIIKRFGGRASGPIPYSNMISTTNKIILNRFSKGSQNLEPIDVLDICNAIAVNVVAGGVRRSAQIASFDANDEAMLRAKDQYWLNPNTQNRKMSNNSIAFWSKPNREFLDTLVESIKNSYEPGFFNMQAANKRAPFREGTNPCGEILLRSEQVCNLVTLFIVNHLIKLGNITAFNLKDLIESAVDAAKHCMRITNTKIELENWDKNQKLDRLLGISGTGWMDAFEAARANEKGDVFVSDGLEENLTVYSREQLLKEVVASVRVEIEKYAKEMSIPKPLLDFTIKPEGTLSFHAGCSAGLHDAVAPYFIRRIRIDRHNPLAKVMKQQGYIIYPEVGGTGWTSLTGDYRAYAENLIKLNHKISENNLPSFDLLSLATSKDYDDCLDVVKEEILSKANTWVIEFVMESPTKRSGFEVTAKEQFERYLLFQKNWTAHNTSITINVGDDEWKSLFDSIYANWDNYIGVSFQNKSNDKYDLAPNEEISKEEFEKRIGNMKPIDLNLLQKLEASVEGLDDDLGSDCSSGACPIR